MSLIERIQVLESVIKHRTEILEEKKNEFNEKNKECNRLQYTCERLATENMRDNTRLNELKQTLNENPILARQ